MKNFPKAIVFGELHEAGSIKERIYTGNRANRALRKGFNIPLGEQNMS